MLSRSFSDRLCLILVSRCFEMFAKNQLRHEGYSLGVLINFGNFFQSFDFLETHSNISWGSEECSEEVSAIDFASYYSPFAFTLHRKLRVGVFMYYNVHTLLMDNKVNS